MTDTPPPDRAAERPDADGYQGEGLVQLSFGATGVLLVVGVVGAVSPDRGGTLTAWVSGVLFAAGVVLLLWGFAAGAARSGDEQITLGGLFFLSGTAPAVVRFRLRLATAVQVVVAVVAASIRPYTAVAFAVLAPMLGLGVMAMWGGRHGEFATKDDQGRGR